MRLPSSNIDTTTDPNWKRHFINAFSSVSNVLNQRQLHPLLWIQLCDLYVDLGVEQIVSFFILTFFPLLHHIWAKQPMNLCGSNQWQHRLFKRFYEHDGQIHSDTNYPIYVKFSHLISRKGKINPIPTKTMRLENLYTNWTIIRWINWCNKLCIIFRSNLFRHVSAQRLSSCCFSSSSFSYLYASEFNFIL